MSPARKPEPEIGAARGCVRIASSFSTPLFEIGSKLCFPARRVRRKWAGPPIARGESTLILAPTGTGKTLAAFLWCINRLMFAPVPEKCKRCRVLYISPIKALAVDVERNLRAPLVGIAQAAKRRRHGVS